MSKHNSKSSSHQKAAQPKKAPTKSTAAKKPSKRLTVDDLANVKGGACTFGDKSGCTT